jgi:hypothetical protein
MIAPVLPATLMACLLPTGKTSVAPTREFDSRTPLRTPSTAVCPPAYHVASNAAHAFTESE